MELAMYRTWACIFLGAFRAKVKFETVDGEGGHLAIWNLEVQVQCTRWEPVIGWAGLDTLEEMRDAFLKGEITVQRW